MKRPAILAMLLVVCGIANSASALVLDFQCAGTGDWNVAANWEATTRTGVPDGSGTHRVPTTADNVFIRDGNVVTIGSDPSATFALGDPSTPGLGIGSLGYIGYRCDPNIDPNQYLLYRDKSTVILKAGGTLSAGRGLDLYITLGGTYSGELIQEGGLYEGGQWTSIGYGGGYTYIGTDPNDPNVPVTISDFSPVGRYVLKDGIIRAADPANANSKENVMYIGNQGGTGEFIMEGGTIMTRPHLGLDDGTKGCKFEVGNNQTYGTWCPKSYGHVRIQGGTVFVQDNWDVARGGAAGLLELTQNGKASIDDLIVGVGWNLDDARLYPSRGTAIIDGDAVLVADRLTMGDNNAYGYLTVDGNAMVRFTNVDGQMNHLGRSRVRSNSVLLPGEGTLNVKGGSVAFRPALSNTTSGSVYLGFTQAASGTAGMNIHSTGVLHVTGGQISFEAGGTARQYVDLGASYSNAAYNYPTGIIDVTGGSFVTIASNIERWKDPNNPNEGTYFTKFPVDVRVAVALDSVGIVHIGPYGYFSVDGNFEMDPSNRGARAAATLIMDVGDARSSKLLLTGSAKLADHLVINQCPGYRPDQGDEFTLIETSKTLSDPNDAYFTGDFASITSDNIVGQLKDPNDPNGLTYLPLWRGSTSGNKYIAEFIGARVGDASGDNSVDGSDLALMGGAWSRSGQTWATGDFTGDGLVDGSDLALMGGNWGWSAPLPGPAPPDRPIPEPASAGLLIVLGLALLRRRRRG
ncbi:MAG: PEP-CTERM sorting domain-containing protein [Phycisphaerae bacterium]|nr:PEP-CTERM sorting domain-containing protein [Phycisphaerae bacterium]